MSDPVTICNIALGYLGAERVTSIEAPSTSNEELCALFYPIVRDDLLEEYDWSFCMGRSVLDTPVAEGPEWGYEFNFPKPTNSNRIIEVRDNDRANTRSDLQWRVEGNYIVASKEKIYVRYVKEVIDTNDFSKKFVKAFAKKLAAEMCIQITANMKLFDMLSGMAEAAIRKASNNDALQGKHEQTHASQLINARQGTPVNGGGF